MVRNKFSILIYLLIGLAAIGLFSQLFKNTVSFFTNIFVMLGIGLAVFAVVYFVFLRKRAPSSDMKKYKQAVKQSKSKYSEGRSKPSYSKKSQPIQSRKKSTKRTSHLRVIDGNKQKRKNRATF